MASILYSPAENGLECRFRTLLGIEIPNRTFEIYHSLGELSARLVMPLSNVKVAVLFAITRTEIMEILSLGDVMTAVKSLLILADDDRETIIKAHKLRPRYVTWVDSDFRHMMGVLRNMVDLYDDSPRSARIHRRLRSMKGRSIPA